MSLKDAEICCPSFCWFMSRAQWGVEFQRDSPFASLYLHFLLPWVEMNFPFLWVTLIPITPHLSMCLPWILFILYCPLNDCQLDMTWRRNLKGGIDTIEVNGHIYRAYTWQIIDLGQPYPLWALPSLEGENRGSMRNVAEHELQKLDSQQYFYLPPCLYIPAWLPKYWTVTWSVCMIK